MARGWGVATGYYTKKQQPCFKPRNKPEQPDGAETWLLVNIKTPTWVVIHLLSSIDLLIHSPWWYSVKIHPCWPSPAAWLRMIDFGLAHSIDEVPMTDSCGTLYYAAPEVLRGHVGVALWGCPTGRSPKPPVLRCFNVFQYWHGLIGIHLRRSP